MLQYDLFLAYAGPDHGHAKSLVEHLHGRITVYWDGFMRPEEDFDRVIPSRLRASRVFTVLVSATTWDGQHYASEELGMAVALARQHRLTIVPIWLDDIPVERRPYGIATKAGISVTRHGKCLGCVAGALVETVLRAKLLNADREWSALLDMRPPSP